MPILDVHDEKIKSMKGLHLYHFKMSSCSQRVRMVLEEKNLQWKSHHIDLISGENFRAEYQRINPKGVVPTLIHDGKLIVESTDIMQYLDNMFPEPNLGVDEDYEQQELDELINLVNAVQTDLKVLTFEYLIKSGPKKSGEQLKTLEENVNNPELKAFYKAFYSKNGLREDVISLARTSWESTLHRLNNHLSGKAWLVGGRYSHADIAWVPNIHRLTLIGLDLKPFKDVRRWYERINDRPAFQRMVANYEDSLMLLYLKAYGLIRNLMGTGINNPRYLSLSSTNTP